MPESNPPAMLAESLSDFSKSVYKIFSEVESQARQEVARSLGDNRELKSERDQALKDLHAAHLESQSWKQELASANAALSQAELTVSHQSDTIASQADTIAQLRRELTHWKNQSRNWQEHFLRVEQERCAQSSRIDELVVEKLQLGRPTPNINASSSSSTSKRAFNSNSSPTQPPAYKTAVPTSPEDPPQFTNTPNTSVRSSAKRPKNGTKVTPMGPVESGSELASSPQKRSRKDVNGESISARMPKSDPSAPLRSSTVIRRVQAVIHVKRESDSEDESPSKFAALPKARSVSHSRSKRHRRIIDDEDEAQSGSDNSREAPQEPHIAKRLRHRSHVNYQEDDEDEEDDELMLIGAEDYSDQFSQPREEIQHSKRPPPTTPAKKKRRQTRR